MTPTPSPTPDAATEDATEPTTLPHGSTSTTRDAAPGPPTDAALQSTTGIVARTLHTSLVDGPGNRFVVFLQGCNFDCLTCHNPQTIDYCTACGLCLEVCAPDALRIVDGRMTFDPLTCDGCDRCIDLCPIDASPMVQTRTVADVLAELRPVAPFVSGVTVSGGEATLQLAFLELFFRAIKTDPELAHLTTFVDTNGSLSAAGWAVLLPWLDGAMVDLKAASPEVHRPLTGRGNAPVLASLGYLADRGRLHEVRLLVIEGVTDQPDEVERYAEAVRALGTGVRLKLMAYRHHGVRPQGRVWPETSALTMDRVAAHLRGAGLTDVVVPSVTGV